MLRIGIITASLLGVPFLAAPAHAAGVSITGVRVEGGNPIVYAAGSTTVRARVWTAGAQVLNVQPHPASGAPIGKYQAVRIGAADGPQQWEVAFDVDKSMPPGKWAMRLSAWDGDSSTVHKEVAFQVKRAVTVTGFNVTPEHRKKGGSLTMTGRLVRLDANAYGTAAYVGYAHQPLKISFSPEKGRHFRPAGTVRTDAHGAFRKKLKAREEGTWRVTYMGSPLYAGHTSGSDFVIVHK